MTGVKHILQPRHHANLYYNGTVGQLDIDFNIDYMWRKISNDSRTDETDLTSGNTSVVNSDGVNHGQSIAEKLVLSYPLWKGDLECGQEFTSSCMSSRYTTNARASCRRVKEPSPFEMCRNPSYYILESKVLEYINGMRIV